MAFDVMSGFQVGQQIPGENSLGSFVRQVMGTVSNIQNQRLQAKGAGLAEEEKMKGMARFYQSPEGQSYMGSMSQLGSGMLSRIGQADQSQKSADSSGLNPAQSYTPEYGITGASFDPLNPTATKYTYGETPQSQMRRDILTKSGQEQAMQTVHAAKFAKFASNIKENVARVKVLPAATVPGAGTQVNPNAPIGFLRRHLGTGDTSYSAAQASINQALIPFLTGIEGATAGRISQQELAYLGNTIRQLPDLPENERQNRYQQIDRILVNYGLQPVFTAQNSPLQGQMQSSPFQPTQDFSQLSDDELRRIAGQRQ